MPPQGVHMLCRSMSLPTWNKDSLRVNGSPTILVMVRAAVRVRTWSCTRPDVEFENVPLSVANVLRDCTAKMPGLTILTLDIPFMIQLAMHAPFPTLKTLRLLVHCDATLARWSWSTGAPDRDCERFTCDDAYCQGHLLRYKPACPALANLELQALDCRRTFEVTVVATYVIDRRPISLTLAGVELVEGTEEASISDLLSCFSSVITSVQLLSAQEDVEQYCHSV
ncbi:hypothetical protein BKA62DRAFT_717604 [Auriculariales sp. MPI-PUGE-AT-0066]|nr:hypothetical protein BKA62DRAFT_717604 [Auriculariales sp. MPI-PUGE-AT-0066]